MYVCVHTKILLGMAQFFKVTKDNVAQVINLDLVIRIRPSQDNDQRTTFYLSGFQISDGVFSVDEPYDKIIDRIENISNTSIP